MSVIVHGKQVRPRKRITLQMFLTKVTGVILGILIPVFLASFLYVFYCGRERLTARADCAIVVAPPLTSSGRVSEILAERARLATKLFREQRVRGIIVTGLKGQFTDDALLVVQRKVMDERVSQGAVIYTVEMKDLEELAIHCNRLMEKKLYDRAVVIATAPLLARTTLLMTRASDALRYDKRFEGYPVPGEPKVEGDRSILSETFRFIPTFLTDFPKPTEM